jgi:hypothetical protein
VCEERAYRGSVHGAEFEIDVAVTREQPDHLDEDADLETRVDLARQLRQLRLTEPTAEGEDLPDTAL